MKKTLLLSLILCSLPAFAASKQADPEITDGLEINLGDGTEEAGELDQGLKSSVITPKNQAVTKSQSLDSELKSSAKGFNRFRWGVTGSIGFQFATGSDKNPHPIEGMLISAGGYLIANPIRDFLDFELGVDYIYVPGTGYDEEDRNFPPKAPTYGMKGARVYVAPIFKTFENRLSIATGAYYDLGISPNINTKLHKVRNNGTEYVYKPAKIKIKNSMGVYIDFQSAILGTESDKNARLIGMVKFMYGMLESQYTDIKEEPQKQKHWGVSFGIKF